MPASASAAVADADAAEDRPRSLRDRLTTVARYDLPASIVVFLVAVPLSIGIAIASNAPIMAGLIAAVVGGIIAGAVGERHCLPQVRPPA